ncbi:MAG: AI-2E family transporter [Gemmobacter sp.]|nr:AI-2E family transporter [Gemmobacter sp.]
MDKATQVATIFIGLVALITAMFFTKAISAPMALALATGILLAPLSDRLERMGMPTAAAALTSLLATLVCIGALLLVFQPIIVALVEAAPKVWADLQELIAVIRSITRGMSDLSKEVAGTLSTTADAQTGDDVAEMPMPDMADALWLAPAIAAQVLTFAGTLFFFLLSRESIYEFVARRLSAPENRAIIAVRLRNAERSVSRYFLTVTAVNAILGLATAGLLALIGMPNAALWGTLAFTLNFILYLGPAVLAVALLFSAVAVFDGALVLAPPLGFLALNMIEGQFLTPAIVGRRSAINPLLVFVSIVFGIWIWGPIGGIVAIPLILWVRILGTGGADQQTSSTSKRTAG